MLALLCLTVSGAWAQDFEPREGDEWVENTKTLTVKSNIDDYEGYDSKDEIEHVIIANTVTTIGECAFSNCWNLKSVSIPSSVTYIGDNAFSGTGLTSVTIPGNEADGTNIGADAFSGCSGLISVNIGSGVKSIENFAFQNCTGLTSVTIGSGVTSIGRSAFYECSSLTSVTIPNSVTSIGQYAFQNCSILTSVILNSNPTIGTDAFTGIADVATVTMNLTANAAGGAYWMTFYNQNYDFEADANTQVFKVALSGTGELTMNKVEGGIVDKNTPVVLKTTGGGNPVMTLTTTASGDTQDNSLKGVSTVAGETSDGTYYVLNYKDGTGVGFYKLASGKTIGLGKAYLTYSGGGVAAARGYFLFDETTGIEMPTVEGNGDAEAVVYDLQGRRVAQPTKGLYIVNGKKVIK